jgi:hypothetical protein
VKDPYLIIGQPCEVWEGGEEYRQLKYFIGMDREGLFPLFCDWKNHDGEWVPMTDTRCYRPINTEWDLGCFPEWAVCSTVDENGIMTYWSTDNLYYTKYGNEWNFNICDGELMTCGLCPDLSRWQGDAWKTSLRMKPEWAK